MRRIVVLLMAFSSIVARADQPAAREARRAARALELTGVLGSAIGTSFALLGLPLLFAEPRALGDKSEGERRASIGVSLLSIATFGAIPGIVTWTAGAARGRRARTRVLDTAR